MEDVLSAKNACGVPEVGNLTIAPGVGNPDRGRATAFTGYTTSGITPASSPYIRTRTLRSQRCRRTKTQTAFANPRKAFACLIHAKCDGNHLMRLTACTALRNRFNAKSRRMAITTSCDGCVPELRSSSNTRNCPAFKNNLEGPSFQCIGSIWKARIKASTILRDEYLENSFGKRPSYRASISWTPHLCGKPKCMILTNSTVPH
mmetsp:Transcript_53707/g.143641  ORF Transcript_53707/g.143641 Transcript_53707/m.143641 type:complete len:204 (+) Transcript_53707:1881-2492(+)